MASRIMPGTRSDEIEDSQSLALIDLEKVAQALGSLTKKAEDDSCDDDSCDVCPGCDKAECTCDEDKKESPKKKPVKKEEEKSDGPFPGAAPPFKKKGEEKEASSEKGLRMPSAKMLADKLSQNDKEGYKEILAQRSAVRAQFMKMAESLPDVDEVDEHAVATAQANERKRILAEVKDKAEREEWRKEILSYVDKEALVNKLASRKESAAKVSEFKQASKVDEVSKIVLAKRLKAAGMDDAIVSNYVKLAFSSAKEEVEVPEFVKTLAAMKIKKTEKTALLKSWVKEAKLNSEDKNRVRDYWANELGYQDKEWCSDMVEDVDPVKGA